MRIMKFAGIAVCVVLGICVGCGTPKIDEKFAADFVKESLSLNGIVTAEILRGGFSGAQLFLVTEGQHKYVVRFLNKAQEKIERELCCLKIASQAGYGPQVYFSDSQKAAVIMEYLPAKQITLQDRRSKELYQLLGRVLRKMHQSHGCEGVKDRFDIIRKDIEQIKAEQVEEVPFATIERLVSLIEQSVGPYVVFTLCHNDINPNNLIFLGDEFKIIDYETCAMSDPYFDVATVAIFFCFSPGREQELLAAYLERQPTAHDQARLYLMKQIAWLNYSLLFLRMAGKKVHLYNSMQMPSYEIFMKELGAGHIDFGNPEHRVKYAKVMINHVITDAETQEFRDALQAL